MQAMTRRLFLLFVCFCAGPAFAEEAFAPRCKLPFAAIATKQPIDTRCGLSGDAVVDSALDAQDQAKNNFCATGTPFVLGFEDYAALQEAAEKVLGANYKPPASRTGLREVTLRGQKLGEGSVVRLKAYVDRARYSDVEKGESVNCNIPGNQNNDIHIPLVEKPGDDECTSVTAEMSPHFRPAAWTPSNLNKLGVQVRITGQLFFDASHKPCTAQKVMNPKRRSVWEIHPVYAVDVCVKAKDCDVTVDSDWEPLDRYVSRQSSKKKK